MCNVGRYRDLSDVEQSGRKDRSGENNDEQERSGRLQDDGTQEIVPRYMSVGNIFIRSNVPNVTTISCNITFTFELTVGSLN